MSAPQLLERKSPEYTAEARGAHLQGSVSLSLVVDADGYAEKIRVTRSLGLGLAEKAIQAVEQWRFEPGLKAGKPVPVIATARVNFTLLAGGTSSWEWYLSGARFQTPDGASRPTVTRAVFPPSDSVDPAKVTVTLNIDPSGIPIDIQIVKSSDPDAARQIVAVAAKWKFNPGLKDTQLISVPCSLEFTRGDANAVIQSGSPGK